MQELARQANLRAEARLAADRGDKPAQHISDYDIDSRAIWIWEYYLRKDELEDIRRSQFF